MKATGEIIPLRQRIVKGSLLKKIGTIDVRVCLPESQ